VIEFKRDEVVYDNCDGRLKCDNLNNLIFMDGFNGMLQLCTSLSIVLVVNVRNGIDVYPNLNNDDSMRRIAFQLVM
jgi:hypothetical protein